MSRKLFWTLASLCGLSYVGLLALHPLLPTVIPVHWSFNGQIDGWGPKSSLLILGMLPLGILLLLWALPKIDPRRENYRKHAKAYAVFTGATVITLLGVTWATVLPALGMAVPIGRVISVLVGCMLIVLGNYLPQARPAFFFGFRTPWALADDTVWRKTNRAGGIMTCISGFLFAVPAFFPSCWNILGLLALLAGSAGVFLYSYFLYRKRKPTQKEDHHAQN